MVIKMPSISQVLVALGVAFICLTQTGNGAAQSSSPVAIEFFTASKTVIDRVEPIALSWSVRDAAAVDLFDGYHNRTFNNFRAQDKIQVWTDRNATFTLIARGLDGNTVTRQISISFAIPDLDPLVDYFYPSVGYLLVGQSTTLQWRSRNGSRVTIMDLQSGTRYEYQPSSGTLAVSPTMSTTYQIQVTSHSGRQVQAQTQIQVTQVPPTQPEPQPYPLPSTYPGGGTIPVPYPFPNPYSTGPYYPNSYGGYGSYTNSSSIYQPLPYPSRLNSTVVYPGGYGYPHHRILRRPR